MQQNHHRPGSSPNKIQSCSIHRRHARSKSAPESRHIGISDPVLLRRRNNASTDAQTEYNKRGTNVKLAPHTLPLLKPAAVRSFDFTSGPPPMTRLGWRPNLDSRVRLGFWNNPKKVIPNP